MKSNKSYILCIEQKKLHKKQKTKKNEFSKGTIQKMNSTFTNSKNSQTFDPHRLLINLADKIDLERKDK